MRLNEFSEHFPGIVILQIRKDWSFMCADVIHRCLEFEKKKLKMLCQAKLSD